MLDGKRPLAAALMGALFWIGLPCAIGRQPPPNTQDPPASVPATNALANTAESSAPRQLPILLELAEKITTEKVKPGDGVRFRVVEDAIVDNLVVIAKGTVVEAKAERLDKHRGAEKLPVLMVRFGKVKAVTGEELPIASTTGNQTSNLEDLTMEFEDWPGVRGFFGRSVRYLPPGPRKVVDVTLPSQFDRARLLAAQTKQETPPGYATVYFLPPEDPSPRPGVWCGAVEIGWFRKVLLLPGNYSCRVERFSPEESYLEFVVVDGGTYYLLSDRESVNPGSGNLAIADAAGAVERWNRWTYPHFANTKAADLTKMDSEMFRKLRPFVCAEPLQCSGRTYSGLAAMYAWAHRYGPLPDTQRSPTPATAAGPATKTAESNGPPPTPMVLELTEDVTSRNAKIGDEVHFHVVDDVIKDGLVVIATGTAVKGSVDSVVKRGGWMRDGGLMVRIGPVRTVTGEELPVTNALGRKGGKRDIKDGVAVSLDPEFGGPLIAPLILPMMPFIKGDDFVLSSGTRYEVEVALPSQLDPARLVAGQPSPGNLPGFATVYVLTGGVWCGAVNIGPEPIRALVRPGNYSCHVETFSQQETYLDFAVADGGTYYLVADPSEFRNSPKANDIRPPALSFTTATGAVEMWNAWIPRNTEDLTKVDPEAFRKLPPFLRVEK